MKKISAVIMAVLMLVLTGCQQAADLVKPSDEDETVINKIDVTTPKKEETQTEEPKTKIVLSQTLNMTNEWTLMGDYSIYLTTKGKKDRVLLATSAISENGEMQWDDSQYWTVAVLTDKGAYNLFFQRIQGVVYAEVNEAFISGIATPVITVYVFSGTDRDIRNYIYDSEEDAFIEDQIFTTKTFSTGGINTIYSTFPEYKAK